MLCATVPVSAQPHFEGPLMTPRREPGGGHRARGVGIRCSCHGLKADVPFEHSGLIDNGDIHVIGQRGGEGRRDGQADRIARASPRSIPASPVPVPASLESIPPCALPVPSPPVGRSPQAASRHNKTRAGYFFCVQAMALPILEVSSLRPEQAPRTDVTAPEKRDETPGASGWVSIV
jgi:hypothetical protein